MVEQLEATNSGVSSIPAAPEVRLLLASGGGDALDGTIVRLATAPLNWDVFASLVRFERAASIVWPRLRRIARDRVPAGTQSTLERHARLGDVRMAQLSRRLDETLAALTRAGIPVLLLKGAALARTVYGSLPRRPMLDLDLLVPHDRLAAAREVVLHAGWGPGPFESLHAFYADHCHLPPFVDREGGDFHLELHHDILFRGHPFGFAIDELWDRARPLPDAPAIRVPDPTHMIIHLAVHFSWSHLMRAGAWRTFRDVRVLLEGRTIDWDRVLEVASRIRALTCCYWTFRLARDLTGAPVPTRVMQRLKPPLPETAARLLERHFVQQFYPLGPACPSLRLSRALWRTAIRPKWSGHGNVVPWQHDDRLTPDQGTRPPHRESAGHWLRSAGQAAAVLAYLRHLFAGSPVARQP